MNILNKKILVVLMMIIVNIVLLVSCKSNDTYDKNEKQTSSVSLNENNAKVLSIKDIDSDDNTEEDELKLSKKIKNISNFSIYNILINYEEINDKDNIASKSQLFLDLTLKPNESSLISFFNDQRIKDINIVSYEYHTLENVVTVDLKNNSVVINKDIINLEDSKKYEVLTTSPIYKVKNSNQIDTYAIDIKNTSKQELGNITIKIGQLDKKGQYIMVDNISSYNILKPSEDVNIEIKALENTEKIKLLGYSYDDIKDKANINIDLKLHKATINN
jgi:hypothetical protein